MNQQQYNEYVSALKEELIPALGCTEPIAIAYASAKAREVLGEMPERIVAQCSGNIIKNVKGVIVPGTGTMKGIETSAILGALVGGSERKLEVLTYVNEEHIAKLKVLLQEGICKVELLKGVSNLHLILTTYHGDRYALVEIARSHTNIVRIEKDGEILFSSKTDAAGSHPEKGRDLFNLRDIHEFAGIVKIEDVEEAISRQIDFNTKIAEEGLAKPYGLNVGSSLLKHFGSGVNILAKAMPAAGSDARMSGCTLPVVTNSGSGNQGMTVSLPVITFARHLNVSKETLYRALVLSNLIAIHLKSGIGKLSAYCGAVTAACGSGAAITYLHGGDFDAIARTVTNMLGNVSGVVCDGAKPSCAAKIASSVDAAIMAHQMSSDNRVMEPGEGIIAVDVEQTIENIGQLAREGMRETDIEILQMMIK